MAASLQVRSVFAATAMTLGFLSLAGCSSHVQSTGTYVAPVAQGGTTLPLPGHVLVYNFSIDPNGLQLDSGMRARIEAMMSKSTDPSAVRQKMADDVDSAISETLVDAINKMGLIAIPATQYTHPAPGDVLIQGQVTRIDAGNRTRRTLIGLGAGKSQVFANVQVLQAAPGGPPMLLQTYDANANSGRTPGLAVAGVGAAAGNVAVAVAGATAGTIMRSRSSIGRDAANLAKKVATNLGTFFASQGWIAK